MCDYNIFDLNRPLSYFVTDPQFVGAFDEGDKVYFFYREIAVETSERVIYSRVARVCKVRNDCLFVSLIDSFKQHAT